MIALLLENNGYKAEVKEGLGGTLVNYEALKKGQIHIYVEYTGTAYNNILKLDPPENWDPDYVYEKSKEEMLSRDGVLTVVKLGFRDDYAIAVKKEFADKYLEIIEILKKLEGLIDTDTMRVLNYKYDVEKKDAREIAKEFLIEKGLISG